MKKSIQLIISVALTLASAVILSGCSDAKSDSKVTKAKKVIAIPVVAEPVLIGSIDAAYGTTAILNAAEEADVVAKASGIVTAVFVEEGEYVEAGQPLAQLEVERLELELKRANAELNQLANDLQRNKKIYEKELISSEAYDRIKFQYDARQAAADLAKLNLENATIKAPISGVVANRYIKAGNFLQQNSAAFHISDLSELHAVVHIPESEKAAIRVGQLANVSVEASDKPFQGRIQRVSPVVDKDTGTIRVTVSLKDNTARLRPGMFGRVSVVYDTHADALLVPKDSILSQDDEVSVYIVKDGIAYKQSVSVGFSNADYVEILEGISAQDMVITTGQLNIKHESNVEIISTVATL